MNIFDFVRYRRGSLYIMPHTMHLNHILKVVFLVLTIQYFFKAKTRVLLLTHARSGLNGISLDGYLQEIRGDPLEEFIRQDMERWRVLAIENSCSTLYEKSEQREYILSMLTKVYTSTKPARAATARDIESGSPSTCNMRSENIVIAMLGIAFVVIIIIVIVLAFRG